MKSGDAQGPGSCTAASLSKQDNQGSSDQAAKPVGTGMFIPLVGRTCSGRSKPNRRRNISTSSLQTVRSEPGGLLRNTSTASLTAPHQQQLSNSTSSPSCTDHVLYMQQHCTPVTAPGNHAAVLRHPGMLLPVADACAPAHTVKMGTSQQGFSSGPQLGSIAQGHPLQQQEHGIWAQPQHLSPFAAMSATASCATAAAAGGSSLTMGFDKGMRPVGIQQALSLPADGSVCHSIGQQYPSAPQQYPSASYLDIMGSCSSSQALTTAGSTASILQDGLLMQGVVIQGGAPYQTAVLMPAVTVGPSAAPGVSFSLTHGGPGLSCSLTGDGPGVSFSLTDGPTAHLLGIVSGSALLAGPHPGREDLLTQAKALGMTEQNLLAAVAAAYSSGTGTPEEQDELVKHINRLSLLKQVLQLKHQHKVQQALLQLQQQQQEHELLQQQQVLASCDRDGGLLSSSGSPHLQQGLVHMLQRCDSSSGVLLSGTTAAAAVGAYSDGAVSIPVLTQSLMGSCTTQAVPNMLSWIPQSQQPALQQQQVQLDPVVLPAQNAASLSYMLQERMSLRNQQMQQTALSAPANVIANGADPTQCVFVGPNWGKLSVL